MWTEWRRCVEDIDHSGGGGIDFHGGWSGHGGYPGGVTGGWGYSGKAAAAGVDTTPLEVEQEFFIGGHMGNIQKEMSVNI